MHKYEQFFDDVGNTILSNENLKKTFHDSVIRLYKSIPTSFVENQSYSSKIFNDKNKQHAYLFIHDNKRNQISVYEDSKQFTTDADLFKWTKIHLEEERDEAYSTDLCCTLNIEQPINKNTLGNHKQYIRGDLFSLQRFTHVLNIQDTLNDETLIKLSGLSNTKSSFYADDILNQFNKLKIACKNHDFNTDNRYSFNDCDNSFWQEADGIVFTEQNISFYAVGDKTNLQIYAYDSAEYDLKLNTTIEDLLQHIKDKPNDLINHTVLKIKDSKIVFADPGLLFNLYLDLQYTSDEIKENLKTPNKNKLK